MKPNVCTFFRVKLNFLFLGFLDFGVSYFWGFLFLEFLNFGVSYFWGFLILGFLNFGVS